MFSLLRENIREALKSIRSQLLRTILTVLIIAFGIMALVGILTSIDAISGSLSSNFSSMGSNTFSIQNRGTNIHVGRRGKKAKRYPRVTFDQAMEFKEMFDYPSLVSVSTRASGLATLKHEFEKTNPNVFVFGIDENYLQTSGYELAKGRNFSKLDVTNGSHGVIIGDEIAQKLFPNKEPLNELVSIGSRKYRVIGVLEKKGSTMGFSADKNAFIPLTNARQYFSRSSSTFLIQVMTNHPDELETATSEATSIFRLVRRDKAGQDNSFDIIKSDSVSQMLMENLSNVTVSATVIGFITLLGAAIGLMNIMLVSVTERTQEIGVRKAMGASAKIIRNQFIIEAIIICQIGGALGIVLGIIIGNLVGTIVGGGFIVPWDWMGIGIALCIVVGLISGIYPAFKAAKLDPIESLRYE